MGLFSPNIASLEDLFLHQLKDLYYAERQIVSALPTMIGKATDETLRSGLEKHMTETEGQIARLEDVFRQIGETPSGEQCPAIDGIIDEAEDIMGDVTDPRVLDAAIAAAAQAVEHYEITRYGTLIAWSRELGRSGCAQLLEQSLQEEKAADALLSRVAEQRLNRAA